MYHNHSPSSAEEMLFFALLSLAWLRVLKEWSHNLLWDTMLLDLWGNNEKSELLLKESQLGWVETQGEGETRDVLDSDLRALILINDLDFNDSLSTDSALVRTILGCRGLGVMLGAE